MAVTAEPRGLDPLTLLRSGGEQKAAIMGPLDTKIDAVGSNAKNAIELAKNLRIVAKANSREAIENIAALKDGESTFQLRNTKPFIERFGSGKKTAGGTMTPAETASFNTAEQLLRENATVALYLDLRTKIGSEQKKLLADTQVQDAIGGPKSLSTIREQALSTILRNPTFINAFPEIGLSGMTQPEKMQYIEATLLPAEDNRFAARLGTLTQEAYRKAVDFTTVAGDDKKTGMEQQEKLEKARMDQKVKGLKALLDAQGITKPMGGGPFTEAEIKLNISGSLSADTAADVLAEQAFTVNHAAFVNLKQFRIELPKQQAELTTRLVGLGCPNPPTLAWLTDPVNKIRPEVINYNAVLADMTKLSTDPGVVANQANFDSKIMPLYRSPAFSNLAQEAKRAELTAADLALQISVLPPGDPAEVAKSRDKRLLEEQDLIGQLDRVLGNSLRDVLLERYDIMEERQGRLMEKNAKDAEKDVAKLVLELKKKMNTNWIKWDNTATNPKRVVQKKEIRRDVTHLTFSSDKDVALKQLIARDIFKGAGGATTINDTNFDKLNVVDGKDGAGNVLITEDQLKQLEKVFESSGQAYKEKLWADMFMGKGRGIFDKTFNFGFGIEVGGDGDESLAFKKAVRDEMMKKYEPEITKAIESKRESSQAMKNLEAQGVKFDFDMKWIWYVLTILLGLPAAAVGTVALPAGIAAAQAAAGGIAATGLTASAIEGAIGGAAGLAVPTVVGSAVGGKVASALEG